MSDFGITITDSRVCEGCREANWCKKDCDSYKSTLGPKEVGSYLSGSEGEIIVIHKNFEPIIFGDYGGIETLEDGETAIKVENAHTYNGGIKKLGEYTLLTEYLSNISIGEEAVTETLRKRIPGMSRFLNMVGIKRRR